MILSLAVSRFGVAMVLACAGVALAAAVVALWQTRCHAARRRDAVLDGYANHEIARARRGWTAKRLQSWRNTHARPQSQAWRTYLGAAVPAVDYRRRGPG